LERACGCRCSFPLPAAAAGRCPKVLVSEWCARLGASMLVPLQGAAAGYAGNSSGAHDQLKEVKLIQGTLTLISSFPPSSDLLPPPPPFL
jgi:hypothetical protein